MDAKEAVAIGGQYGDRFVVEIRVQAPWRGRPEDVDRLLDAVDATIARAARSAPLTPFT